MRPYNRLPDYRPYQPYKQSGDFRQVVVAKYEDLKRHRAAVSSMIGVVGRVSCVE